MVKIGIYISCRCGLMIAVIRENNKRNKFVY